MTVALWCILIAIILPYVCVGVAKVIGGYREEVSLGIC